MFYRFWIASTIFSALFILLQSFLLVDFAWSWAQKWIDRWEDTGDSFYKHLLIGFCAAFFAVTVAGSILLFFFFGPPNKPGCSLNTYLVAVNLVLSLVHSVVSVLPVIQEQTPRSGLFQSAFLSVYTTYLVASSIASQSKESELMCGLGSGGGNEDFSGSMVYFGLALTFIALGYSAFSTGSSSSSFFRPLPTSEEDGRGTSLAYGGGVGGDAEEEDDEQDGCAYNYSYFHLVFLMAAFYTSMVLTDWRVMEADWSMPNGVKVVHGNAARWVKVSTSWVCIVLYLWTLVAPLVLPDRDFGG